MLNLVTNDYFKYSRIVNYNRTVNKVYIIDVINKTSFFSTRKNCISSFTI